MGVEVQVVVAPAAAVDEVHKSRGRRRRGRRQE